MIPALDVYYSTPNLQNARSHHPAELVITLKMRIARRTRPFRPVQTLMLSIENLPQLNRINVLIPIY